MTKKKKPVGRPTKLTPKLIKRLADAIGRGCSYRQAAMTCGVVDQTLYKWLRQGRAGTCERSKKLSDAVATAENDRLLKLLDIVTTHASKDWRAGAFLLERRYGYTKENKLNDIPVEDKEIHMPDTLEGILKQQLTDISKAMAKAHERDSFQAYAALQRQLIAVVTQLKELQDDNGELSEFDEMTDEQILTIVENSFLSLPPILRQRAIDRLGNK